MAGSWLIPCTVRGTCPRAGLGGGALNAIVGQFWIRLCDQVVGGIGVLEAHEGASPTAAPRPSRASWTLEPWSLASPSSSKGDLLRDPAIQLQPPSMATGTGAETTPSDDR